MSRIVMHNTSNLRSSQSGIVSLLVTMVLMVVISLVVLGFAQLARRNQTNQLNQQLSSQAFYAAESGVNDAVNRIQQELAAGIQPSNLGKTTCGNSGIWDTLVPTLNSTDNVSYSCLTVNPSPPVLQYQDIGQTSTIVPLTSSTGNPINKLTLTWQTPQATTTPMAHCPGTTNGIFSVPASWDCGFGILRVDLVPTSSATNTAASLATSTMTFFVVPDTTGSTNPALAYPAQPASTQNAKNAVALKCSNTTGCTLNITGLSSTQYYMRVSSQEEDAKSLQVSATNTVTGALPLTGAQAIIDATGKAQNVLRRIQVYVPLGSTQNALPDFALESSDSICKRFAVMSGYYANDIPTGLTGANALCQN
jgi:Tfp pilus assembly protein PilX